MIPPPPGRRPLARPACTALVPTLVLTLAAAASLGAQNIGTVRDNEFRSRWADYQVDRPQQTTNGDTASTAVTDPVEQTGLFAALGRSLNDYFRNGPLQVRGNLAAGVEFTDEDTLRMLHPDGSTFSPYLAPAFGVFYNQERGPLTISARYSFGYVYYLDQNYLAASHDGGILSQTAGLDITLEGKRTTFLSSFAGSYGNGTDIESGELRTLLNLSETLGGVYRLTDLSQIGATANATYQTYSGGTVAATNTTTDAGSVYADYVITGKTKLRFEFDAGQQLQDGNEVSTTSDRYYYQAVVSANYAPAPKLSFEAGLGYGFQSDSDVGGRGQSGSHPVYRLTIQYLPTAKTTASFHFGYEGVDVDPDLQLAVQWQFRENTSSELSVYQNSNYSTFEIGQNLVTRGVLATVQQRLFARMNLTLSAGAEQSSGYQNINGAALTIHPNEDPYYFAGVALLYEINSYLAIQGYYRGYTGEAGEVTNEKGLQSRASLSLRLTF